MPAYMIITAISHDRPAVLEYAAAAAALTERMGGRYLLRARGADLLEGDFGADAGVLVTEWPDIAAARAFWNSPDYAPLKAMRAGKADVQVLLVEGQMAPPLT